MKAQLHSLPFMKVPEVYDRFDIGMNFSENAICQNWFL